MNEKIWGMTAALILVLGGGLFGPDAIGSEQESNVPSSGARTVEVGALRLREETVTVYEELPGRTVAFEIAEIRPQVSGIVTDRLFEEGSTISKGQQLYQIDPAPYQAAYERALADLAKAEALVKPLEAKNKRFEDLVKLDAVSQQEYDDIQAELAEAKADVGIAKAAVSQAKIDLDYTRVYSPISGRIGKSQVTKGALVTANQAQVLAIVTVLDPIYVDITQSSADLMRLRRKVTDLKALAVVLTMEDGREFEHRGKVLFHEVNVEQTTGSVKLRSRFPNPDRVLLPGLFVRARIGLEYPNAVLLPQRATQRQADGSLSVWVVDRDGAARPVKIRAERAVGNAWLVAEGVKAEDVVVIEGQMGLEPGTRVHPVFSGNRDENDESGE